MFHQRLRQNGNTKNDQVFEDSVVFSGVLPVYLLILNSHIYLPWEDCLSKDMRLCFQTGVQTLSLLFGIQCFVETRRILGEKVSTHFDELVKIATETRDSYAGYCEVRSRLGLPQEWPTDTNRLADEKLVKTVDDWIVADVLRDIAPVVNQGHAMDAPSPFYLFSHYPLLCGIWTFAPRCHATPISLNIADFTPIPESVAHLRNAIVSERAKDAEVPLLPHWERMNTFVTRHQDKLFGGIVRPDDSQSYRARYYKTIGVSISLFARDRKKLTMANIKSKWEATCLDSVLHMSLELLASIEATACDLGRVDAVLTERYRSTCVAGDREGLHRVRIGHKDVSPENALRLSVQESPAAMTIAIMTDHGGPCFDNFSFICECWELLETLTNVPALQSLVLASTIPSDQLSLVTCSILTEMADTDKLAFATGRWKRGDKSTHSAMEALVRWMEIWLQVREMKEMRKNAAGDAGSST